MYYLGAEFYLIDPSVLELATWQAIGISLASLAFGWMVYNTLCKVFVEANQTVLMIALFGVLVVMSYFYVSVFSGRAALLHLGAFTATIMSANVFMIIIPNQKIVVADLIAGNRPDPQYGKIAKQRSTHNNYLTLPVIFLMLSNHYPLAFSSQYNWIIAALVFLMGVTIRHWFNTQHARKGSPTWTWLATVILFILIVWLSTAPLKQMDEDAAFVPGTERFAATESFADVQDVVLGRCSMCHAREPVWDGIHWAPKGVLLETEADIARHARDIYLQSGVAQGMPPANITWMEAEERALIMAWYREATGG